MNFYYVRVKYPKDAAREDVVMLVEASGWVGVMYRLGELMQEGRIPLHSQMSLIVGLSTQEVVLGSPS